MARCDCKEVIPSIQAGRLLCLQAGSSRDVTLDDSVLAEVEEGLGAVRLVTLSSLHGTFRMLLFLWVREEWQGFERYE